MNEEIKRLNKIVDQLEQRIATLENEQRPLTEEQYRDTNYTLNTGE